MTKAEVWNADLICFTIERFFLETQISIIDNMINMKARIRILKNLLFLLAFNGKFQFIIMILTKNAKLKWLAPKNSFSVSTVIVHADVLTARLHKYSKFCRSEVYSE